jgi:hypothetical protein
VSTFWTNLLPPSSRRKRVCWASGKVVYIEIMLYFSPNPLCPSECRQYVPLSACTRRPDNTVSQYESSPSASCSIEQLFSSRFAFTLCCNEYVQNCLWYVTPFRWCPTFRSILVPSPLEYSSPRRDTHCELSKRPAPTTAYLTAQCPRLQRLNHQRQNASSLPVRLLIPCLYYCSRPR